MCVGGLNLFSFYRGPPVLPFLYVLGLFICFLVFVLLLQSFEDRSRMCRRNRTAFEMGNVVVLNLSFMLKPHTCVEVLVLGQLIKN